MTKKLKIYPGYSNESDKPHLALIDHLLDSYFAGRCSEKLIKEQIETMLMAGSDTTALTISFAILMLAMHPEIQERLFEELQSVYDTQDEATLNNHLTRLTYLDCCLKETMRLFPVASLIGRTPTVDIPVSNCTIPKGTIIALSILTLHRVNGTTLIFCHSFSKKLFSNRENQVKIFLIEN